jgi:aspartate/methionine/tyrosine aminotransferase
MSLPEQALNPLARELNEKLAESAPEILAMLSALGRRLYFPKGILSQSAEAKQKAHRFNATIGIATEKGQAMHLASVQSHLSGISPDDAFTYAAASGRQSLRERWREKQLEENPSQRGKAVGLPIVTSALTHGLAIVGDLFVEAGDVILLPDQLWGNYRLTYEVRLGAKIVTYPFYAQGGFDTRSFAAALAQQAEGREKLIVLLNFPNNPTGYMPTEAEGQALVAALRAQAERGTKLVVVLDDAYFGLFYHLGGASMTESLFGRLANLHPNLLAIRLDGATKELFVWGLRCGFLSFGPGRAAGAEQACAALEAKVKGAIRGAVSNSPQLSQTLVEKALASSSVDAERKEKREILRVRAQRVYEVANAARFRDYWDVYPFNSGYFMCVRLKGVEAEPLRVHLLDRHQTGLIATAKHDLRIAFSCLEVEQVEPLFDVVKQGIDELQSSGRCD